ncbi:MAG: PhnD/SsuA/transferrin family substrate-binding protein [Moraxellaceae bacterium]|nr:PhnD/SsuA/transferrin family substrate-binding protein [Moraxellaceae bacterium]MBP9045724.1 PhnD/SsuA/transferrin family substrate-binding protein [Moraxellaceae bacterium]
MPVNRCWLSAFVLLASLLGFFPEPAAAAGARYSIAIAPTLPATEIKRRWQPLLDQLQRDTGFVLKFHFYKDSIDFEEGLQKSEPDFALIDPLQLWKVRTRYLPIVRDAAPIVDMILVRKDSPLQSLADLNKHTLATAGGNDMASLMLYTQTFKSIRIQPRLHVHRTHSNGLRAVILGRLDAAISNSAYLQLMPVGLAQQMRTIHQTSPMTGQAFAVARRIPADDLHKMKAALLHLKESHAELLPIAQMPNIIEADLERDYSFFANLIAAETSDVAN